jgi:hypothetical protein
MQALTFLLANKTYRTNPYTPVFPTTSFFLNYCSRHRILAIRKQQEKNLPNVVGDMSWSV